jgi:hypothetical protein
LLPLKGIRFFLFFLLLIVKLNYSTRVITVQPKGLSHEFIINFFHISCVFEFYWLIRKNITLSDQFLITEY